jgi:hypothetical protein
MESEGSNGWSMPHSAKVRSDGTFSVDELAPGTYRAQLEGHFSGGDGRSITSDPGPRETVDVISGQTSALHFRGAPPGSVRLRGRLLREGKGLSGHLIEMSGIEPSRSDVETISRANGDYSIILEGPGTYQVKVRPGDGGQRQIWTIEVGSGSQAMDLNLPSMGLTVIVTGPGGSALPFALDASHFSVEMMGVGPRRGSVDASGVNGNEVKFEGLAPETYRLRYTANVRRWNRTEETAESPSAWVLPRDLEITLQAGEAHKTAAAELRPGARLTGRVNDIPSDASRFLYVTVISEEGGGNIKTARIINGEFSVSGLLEGEVRVTCDGTNVDSEESHKAQVSYEAPAFLEIPYPTETE